jgi:hypothetical protein
MAIANPQTQSIQVVNGLIMLAQQLMGLYSQLEMLDAQWTDQNVATTIAAMTTAALNADGSIGANDGTPNSAHPLSPVAYPMLMRSMSSTQIGQLKSTLDAVVTYINGGAVSANPGARAILNGAVGG